MELSCLTWVGSGLSCKLEARLKKLSVTNAVDYFSAASAEKKESFIRLRLGDFFILQYCGAKI
jgi:hypothetical protein